MINPLRPIWVALRDVFDEFALLLGCNVIWCALSLPPLWAAYLVLEKGYVLPAALTVLAGVLTAGPASAALAYVANRTSEGRATRFGEFFVAMRSYARPGWTILGLWVLGLLVILFDIGFYQGMGNLFGAIILGLWIYLLVIWLAMLIYLFPLMAMQEQFRMRLVARSAALMVLGRPVFTAINLALMLLVLGLSALAVVPIVLITPALLSVWSVRAARTLIDDARRRQNIAEPDAEPSPAEKGRKGQVRPK